MEGFSMNTVKNNTQRSNKLSAVLDPAPEAIQPVKMEILT